MGAFRSEAASPTSWLARLQGSKAQTSEFTVEDVAALRKHMRVIVALEIGLIDDETAEKLHQMLDAGRNEAEVNKIINRFNARRGDGQSGGPGRI